MIPDFDGTIFSGGKKSVPRDVYYVVDCTKRGCGDIVSGQRLYQAKRRFVDEIDGVGGGGGPGGIGGGERGQPEHVGLAAAEDGGREGLRGLGQRRGLVHAGGSRGRHVAD